MVPRSRLERLTFPLGGGCSIQLSYRGSLKILLKYNIFAQCGRSVVAMRGKNDAACASAHVRVLVRDASMQIFPTFFTIQTSSMVIAKHVVER